MKKLRSLIVAAFAAAVVPALAQSWDDKVTLTTGARPVADVIAELYRVSGMPMAVEGLAKNDIVCVKLKDVPVGVAAQKIAEATGSKWVEKDGIRMLVRSAADERATWAADAADRESELRASMGRTEASLERMRARGDASENAQIGRFATLLKLLQLITARPVAELEPTQRVVYANDPTSMQRALPAGGMSIVRDYIAGELAFLEAELADLKARLSQTGSSSQGVEEKQREVDRLRNAKTGKALFIVQGFGAGMFLVRLDVVDLQSHLLSTCNMMLETGAADANPDTAPAVGEPLKLSDRATNLAMIWRQAAPRTVGMGQHVGGAVDVGLAEPERPLEINGSLREFAADPVSNEPLGFFAAELLQEAADAEGASLIACIPDSAMTPAADAVASRKSAKSVWQEIAKLDMTAHLSDGIYLAFPRRQSSSRYERLNRVATANLIAAATPKGYPSLDDLGEYAANTSRGGYFGPMAPILLAIAHPETGYALARNIPSQEVLAMFAALGETRRKGMIRDQKPLPLSTVDISNPASWLTFNAISGPSATFNLDADFPPGAIYDSNTNTVLVQGPDGSLQRFSASDYFRYRERTDMLPTGLPAATTISLKSEGDTVIRATDTQNPTADPAFLIPEALGSLRAQRDSPVNAGVRDRLPEYRAFVIGRQNVYTLTITYADGYVMKRQLQEFQFAVDAKPLSYGELPKEVRDVVEDAYRIMLDTLKNPQGQVGGATRTPPP
jgi:hypothetical protein